MIARWQIKCLIDNCKGLVPFSEALRRTKRRLVPYRPSLSRGAYAIEEGLTQVQWIREAMGTVIGKTVLEIGTGWEPLVPMLFSLCGSKRVYLTDLTALTDRFTVAGALETFRADRQPILDALHIDPQTFDEKFGGEAGSLDRFLSRHGFVYLAPCDCSRLPLDGSTLDVIISRSVFEHIRPRVIAGILRESYRVLKPGGLACHFIDESDHWQHNDKSISRVNFLRFSDGMHRLTHLNSLNFHNRLRHPEYVRILEACGFEMLREERTVDVASLKALTDLPLAPRFRSFSREDLATTDSYLLARKPVA